MAASGQRNTSHRFTEDSSTAQGASNSADPSCTPRQGRLFGRTEHEIWREFLDALTCDQVGEVARSRICRGSGTSSKVLLNYLNPHNRNNMPLAKFVRLVAQNLVPEALDRLCDFAGGFFVSRPEAGEVHLTAERIDRADELWAQARAHLRNAGFDPNDRAVSRLLLRAVIQMLGMMERVLSE